MLADCADQGATMARWDAGKARAMDDIPHERFERVVRFLNVPNAEDAVCIHGRRDEGMVVKPNVPVVNKSNEIFDVSGAHDPADDILQLLLRLDLDNDRVIVDKRLR
jgi:hypothetical protein